jgi:hypothetical protein
LPQKRLTLFLASPLRPFWVPLPRFRVANYGLRTWFSGCGKLTNVFTLVEVAEVAHGNGVFHGILQGFLVWPLSAARAQTGGAVFKLAFDAFHEGAKLSVGQKRGTREFTALTPKSCSYGRRPPGQGLIGAILPTLGGACAADAALPSPACLGHLGVQPGSRAVLHFVVGLPACLRYSA